MCNNSIWFYASSILIFHFSVSLDSDVDQGSWGRWRKTTNCDKLDRKTTLEPAIVSLRYCYSQNKRVNLSSCDGAYRIEAPCTNKKRPVVKGFKAKLNRWTSQVFIELDDGADQCGGSLISDNWILTAAHCFNSKKATRISFSSTNKDAPEKIAVNTIAQKVMCHKDFDSRDLKNDICLIKIPWIEDKGYATPIPYLFEESIDIPAGTECRVAGWGYDEHGNLQQFLREAAVKIIDRNDCVKWHEEKGTNVPPNTICAGHKEGGADTCAGDSGGPLICKINNVDFLYGIISFGPIKCGSEQLPGIYTKVENFWSWIKETIEEASRGYRWTAWQEVCTVTCDEGELLMYRTCLDKNNETVDSEKCGGFDFDIDLCFLPDCPSGMGVPKYLWSTWTGECNTNCGIGAMNRTRHCLEKKKKVVKPRFCGDEPPLVLARCYNTRRCSDNVSCYSAATDFIEKEFDAICPPGCPPPSSARPEVWGTNVYTDDSYLCAAATHYGILQASEGGKFTVWKTDGQDKYYGSTQNGIISIRYYLGWEGSIVFEDPNYSWGPWIASRCSASCGKGTMIKVRSCLPENPSGEIKCKGSSEMIEDCIGPGCKLSATFRLDMVSWGPWISGSCSVTCGVGEIKRTRQCKSPDGPFLHCHGKYEDEIKCETPACGARTVSETVSTETSAWSPWVSGSCSVTCGIGEVTRTRTCKSDENLDSVCPGELRDKIPCESPACEKYTWSKWEGDCSVTCGNGTAVQRRKCLDQKIAVHNKHCQGNSLRKHACSQPSCKNEADILYQWGKWGTYRCTITCGKGTMVRERQCVDKDKKIVNNTRCGEEPATQKRPCRLRGCKTPSRVVENSLHSWGSWQSWSSCKTRSNRCQGLQTSLRNCLRRNGGRAPPFLCRSMNRRERSCTLPNCN